MYPKNYVLDTNVLVHDYNSFSNILKGNKITIPYVVLEELDSLKTKTDQVGVNARNVIKLIEKELIEGNDDVDVFSTNSNKLADDKIIDVCEELKLLSLDPILVTKDVCLRTKARAKGISTEDYKRDKVNVSNLYTGLAEQYVSSDIIELIYDKKVIDFEQQYYPNQAVVLVNNSDPKMKAITVYKNNQLHLVDNKLAPFGLECANLEQQIAANFLLDPDINLVTLTGGAGSGKSLIAIASALEAVIEQQLFRKLTVARPIMPFQKDVGYLKGDLKEKLTPWFAPIMDNLDFLFSYADQPNNKKRAKTSPFEELSELGLFEMLPLTFIRGRSIPYQYILVDEAQNLTASELKTVLTRAGKDTKIVLTGDFNQIDNPYLSADNNGLVYCVDKFKNQSIAAHISMSKCERSELAKISSDIL